MKKVLFIPSDHGGGRGHVSRCIYLAKKLKGQGTDVAIVLEKKHYNDGLMAGLHTFLFKTSNERFVKYQFKKPHRPGLKLKTKVLKRPVFVGFTGLSYQVPRDGYFSEKIVDYRLKQFTKIVENYKPDVLVGDAHFLTRLIGLKFQIPVIQITRLAGYPPHPDFLWWEDGASKLTEPDALGPFRKAISDTGLTDVTRIENLLGGDQYIIPANCSLEPVEESETPVIYSGPFTEIRKSRKTLPFFKDRNEFPIIYITIGGGAGRSQENRFFENILTVFDKTDFKVLVSTAGRVPARRYKGRSANVVFTDWVDGAEAIGQSDLVIHHGGYGTTMEVLFNGKPSLVIPSHSEQEGNGRRLENLGLGKLIPAYSDEPGLLSFDWPFGEYQMQAAFEFRLNRELILDSIRTLLYSDTHARLKNMSDSLVELQNQFDVSKLLSL